MTNGLQKYTNKRPVWVWLVGFLALCVVVPILVSAALNAAHGAEPGQVDKRQCSFSDPDSGACFTPAQMATKFRHGTIHHVHGINEKALFAAPKKSRDLIKDKLVHYLKHHPKARAAVARSVDRYHAAVTAKTAGKCCSFPTNWITQCHVVCLSGWAYARAHEKDGCAGDFFHNALPLVCTPGQKPMTWDQFKAGVSVTICGGLVVFGVVSAPETAGGGTVASGAAAGAFACSWSFFDSLT